MKNHPLRRCLCSLALLGFLVGIHQGRIAIWKDGSAAPMKVFPYPVITLPPQVQAQLKEGIAIDSAEDLERLLENLLS